MSVLRLRFLDGTLTVVKDCKEYTSGLNHFFVAIQSFNSNVVTALAFDRDQLEYVERKGPDGEFYTVNLKKRRVK